MYKKALWILIGASTLIRLLLAATFELGNDEVYYRLFAMYPDWSHFDHPPMVGWVIWLTSLGMAFTGELAFRLSAVIFGAVNTWLIFRIGVAVKNERTGWVAALLYTASIYAFIISGTFIMPDAPLSFCWLMTLWLFTKMFDETNAFTGRNRAMLLSGLFIGLAFLSKYTALSLWGGLVGYILFFNRPCLKRPALWGAVAITALCMLPVFIWNLQNDFISFTYHYGRVNDFMRFRPDYLGVELAGEFLYNNPVNFIVSIIAVTAFFRKRSFIDRQWGRLLLWVSLPVIIGFWLIACFRSTLPHWSAPALVTLIPLAAAWIDEKYTSFRYFSGWNIAGLSLLVVGLSIACLQIKTGFLNLDEHPDGTELGKYDFSLDMYGWRQAGEGFAAIQQAAENSGAMPEGAPIISYRWFPAANLDYYVAEPNHTYVLALGELDRIHKFAWINNDRGGFYEGMDAWYLTSSFDFTDPQALFSDYFQTISEPQVIKIYRCGNHVLNFYVYQLKDMVRLPGKLSGIASNNPNRAEPLPLIAAYTAPCAYN